MTVPRRVMLRPSWRIKRRNYGEWRHKSEKKMKFSAQNTEISISEKETQCWWKNWPERNSILTRATTICRKRKSRDQLFRIPSRRKIQVSFYYFDVIYLFVHQFINILVPLSKPTQLPPAVRRDSETPPAAALQQRRGSQVWVFDFMSLSQLFSF